MVVSKMFLGAPAQTAAVSGSPEDINAIEELVHSNPSNHVTEDVSFTNIFGTVRFGREEFIKRHLEIAQTFLREQQGKAQSRNCASFDQTLPSQMSLESLADFKGLPRTARGQRWNLTEQIPAGSCQGEWRLVDHRISKCRSDA